MKLSLLKALRGLCRRALSIFDADAPAKPLWNLKPEVEGAFRAAWEKPVTGGVLPPRPKDRGWRSRFARWVVQQPAKIGMKEFVLSADGKGLVECAVPGVTYRRAMPKRDMTVSARQAKRMRMASCRCAA